MLFDTSLQNLAFSNNFFLLAKKLIFKCKNSNVTSKISILANFCPELSDPVGGFQICKDWGAGGQFKVCEIQCNQGLRFSQEIPQFYTCGVEGFWRPTKNPNLPLIYPACSGKQLLH